MEIKRDRYLNKLISFMWDGQVKVITGIRRCGKSYLLRNLFRTYLLGEGVPADHILSFELDLTRDIRYRNPLELANRVREIVENQREQFYLFLDEIQMSDEVPNPYNPDGKKITFYDTLNDLKSLSNLDIYVTGSNSRMLSSDILTEFRGRSDEIRVHPLSFAEYYSAVGGDKEDAFENYAFYGGMPLILSRPTDAAKMQYLRSLRPDIVRRPETIPRPSGKQADGAQDTPVGVFPLPFGGSRRTSVPLRCLQIIGNSTAAALFKLVLCHGKPFRLFSSAQAASSPAM